MSFSENGIVYFFANNIGFFLNLFNISYWYHNYIIEFDLLNFLVNVYIFRTSRNNILVFERITQSFAITDRYRISVIVQTKLLSLPWPTLNWKTNTYSNNIYTGRTRVAGWSATCTHYVPYRVYSTHVSAYSYWPVIRENILFANTRAHRESNKNERVLVPVRATIYQHVFAMMSAGTERIKIIIINIILIKK